MGVEVQTSNEDMGRRAVRDLGMRDQQTEMNEAAELLNRAQQAVNRGDVVTMLDALFASRYLDGLTRRLQKRWGGSLPWTEIDDCIAWSVEAAYEAVSCGRPIRCLGAWLWKSADNLANDRWRFDYSLRAEIDEDTVPGSPYTSETDHEMVNRQELDEIRRSEAIRIARELLPRIGDGQIRDVMELVIDAAEDKLPDLPAASIADALGISKSAARALVSRGMKRLRRLAEQEGVEAPTDLPETDTEEEEYHDA